MPKVTELERAEAELKLAFSAPRAHAVANRTTPRFAEMAIGRWWWWGVLFSSIYNSAEKLRDKKLPEQAKQLANSWCPKAIAIYS